MKNKIILSVLAIILPISVMAGKQLEIEREAIKECEAFNDIKHTKNRNNISLKKGYPYRIIEHREAQIRVLIDYISQGSVRQRWVDSDCFYKKKRIVPKKVEKKRSNENILAISWQNAFCQTHQRKQECINRTKSDFGSREFLLHGLWPQPRTNQYCDVDKKNVSKDKRKQWSKLEELKLSPKTRGKLAVLMGGYESNLHRHEWIKHGSCYGTNADEYYTKAMDLLQEVNYSMVGEFFANNINQTVNIKDIRRIFDKKFGQGAGDRVDMRCKKGLIVELWLHLKGIDKELSNLLKNGEKVKSSCNKGKVDDLGF